jgi:hypothetical protein
VLRDAPNSLQGPMEFEIATFHTMSGNRGRAPVLMDQAVQSGFDSQLVVAFASDDRVRLPSTTPRGSLLSRQENR